MLFSSLLAVASAAIVSATPAKRIDNREWINLQVVEDYYSDLCVGLPPIADGTYLGGAFCGSSNSTIENLTELIVVYGVGKSSPIEITKYGCPTSAGADLTGASNIPVVDCDIDDENQFWTIQSDGTVTNDATGTCLTMGRKAPSAPLTLNSCGGPFADLQQFTYYDVESSP